MSNNQPENFLTEALDKALKEFGTYSYYDKGVTEVMYADEHINKLTAMSADEVVKATEILRAHEHGSEFYSYIYMCLVEDEEHPEADELHKRMPSPYEMFGENHIETVTKVSSLREVVFDKLAKDT